MKAVRKYESFGRFSEISISYNQLTGTIQFDLYLVFFFEGKLYGGGGPYKDNTKIFKKSSRGLVYQCMIDSKFSILFLVLYNKQSCSEYLAALQNYHPEITLSCYREALRNAMSTFL